MGTLKRAVPPPRPASGHPEALTAKAMGKVLFAEIAVPAPTQQQ